MSKTAQMLIVVVPLLIIVAILVTCATRPESRADSREITLLRMDLLAVTVKEFQIRKGRLATDLAEVVAFGRLDPTTTNDAWGRPLMFSPFDYTLGCGTIISYGSDGVTGGLGESCDIRTRIW